MHRDRSINVISISVQYGLARPVHFDSSNHPSVQVHESITSSLYTIPSQCRTFHTRVHLRNLNRRILWSPKAQVSPFFYVDHRDMVKVSHHAGSVAGVKVPMC